MDFAPWEPEETVGKLWHALASRLDAAQAHDGAAVALPEVAGRLAVFFRALGGPKDAAIRAAAQEVSAHRIGWRRKLTTDAERLARPSFDREALRLPDRIAVFPEREANAALYFWLTAAAAHAPEPEAHADPLRADIAALRAARAMTEATLADCPGLGAFHALLAKAARNARPARALPRWEAAAEAAVLDLLGGAAATGDAARMLSDQPAEVFDAPQGYRPFAPVALWPDLRAPETRGPAAQAEDQAPQGPAAEAGRAALRAKRRASDQAERRDSLILHKFEAIFSWADFFNLNRRVEDDDEDGAKKAADDLDEISLGQVTKKAATRLKLHLDLSPQEADRDRLSGAHLYPEWDARGGVYLPDHCRVLASPAPEGDAATLAPDARARRRIRAVKRQFEALRPARVILPRQLDGDDIDIEAAVAAQVELRACGACSDRVYRATRAQARDLAVSILLDISRSTESACGDRMVIDVEKEALTALAWGLEAAGDATAIRAFSSLRRDRVYVLGVKDFSERMGAQAEARIAGLRPGFYTRLGAAVRHVSAELAKQPQRRKLLLVISDGKPNDLDHYEGRHGIEDSRMAIREARRRGLAAHGVIVEAKGEAWFARIFGRGGFSLVADPDRLTVALPQIYRHLVGG